MEFERLALKDSENLEELVHQAYKADEELGIHFKASVISTDKIKEHLEYIPTYGYKNTRGELISTVSVRLPWSNDPGPFALPHLGWVATNPRYQRQGYGKKIINDVIENYVKMTLNSPAVTLGTAIEHPWLQQTYISLGFIPIEEVKKVADHKTVYLIKIFNKSALNQVSDKHLQLILKKIN